MAQPSDKDLTPAFDITGYNQITAAQLMQWLSGTVPYTDKGIVVATEDIGGNPQVPNALIETKWQNYIWLRKTTTQAIAYVWNSNGSTDVTLLNWQTLAQASIGPGSITGIMIAAGAITDDKITSVGIGKIAPDPYGIFIQGSQGIPAGDLVGSTYSAPVIALNAVTGGAAQDAATGINKIANNTINYRNLATNAVTVGNITPTNSAVGNPAGVVNGQLLETVAGVAQWTTPNVIFNVANPSVGNNGQLLGVVAGAWGLIAPAGVGGRILQSVTLISTTTDTAANVSTATLSGNPITTWNSVNTNQYAGFNTAFTPLSSSSTLLVEVDFTMAPSTGATTLTTAACAVFRDPSGSTAASAINYGTFIGSSGNSQVLKIVFTVASGSLSATTFKVGWAGCNAGPSGSMTVNTNALSATFNMKSYMRITEYL